MKSKIYLILALSLSTFGLFSFTADDDSLKSFLEKIQTYFRANVQEKVYLHTDKPFYAVGDDIWFKAYVVNAENLTPTPNSNILYVDLIDGKNAIKKTIRLPLVAGFGWGNFELKDSLQEGNYRLRAYTTWMRNFDQDFFYDKTFKIGNAWTNQLITKANYSFTTDGAKENVSSTINFSNMDAFPYANKNVNYSVILNDKVIEKGKTKTNVKGDITFGFSNDKAFLGQDGIIEANIEVTEGTIITKTIPIKSTSNNVDVQFFPESGNLVSEVRTKIAFKAVGADGLGKKIEGYVKDNEGLKVAIITTKHLGMGFFNLMCSPNKTYEAVVKFEDGSEKTFKLPTAQTEGINLSVYNISNDSLSLKVANNKSFLDKNADKEYTVIAQNHGTVFYTAKSKIKSLAFAAKLDKSRFLPGINQITLFNENMLPVAERLVFIAPKDTLAVNIKSDKSTYTTRGKVNLNINALAPNGKPVIGSFSIAVTDNDKVKIDSDEEENIYTNLLLTSDIKGFVENPNYYLTNINEEKEIAADVLMLTQAWRRFNWKNLSTPTNYVFKPERTLSISGRITQGKDKPIEGGTVTIFSSGGKSFLLQAKTDALGEFKVDSLYFPDSTKFVIQARGSNGKKNVEIEVYNSTFPLVTKNINQPNLTVNINESMMAYLKNSKSQYEEWLRSGAVNRSILLGEVVVVEKKAVIESSSNLNGAGNADRVLTEKDLENSFSIEQALQGRVAGLTVINGIATIRNQQAQIIMDGIFVEPDFLNSIPIQDVESIEILKNIGYTAIYGSRGGGGVIIINTKRGKPGYVSNTWAPGILTHNPLGIFNPKEFYVPNYEDPKINTSTADLRTTIYWNPNIITDSLGNANVSFFNADNVGNYKVTLEGMDLNGHIAKKVINYKVTPRN
ncbi:carboxypeptidase-like regulatory domain-containing protein [Pedobacter alpinus]|uniref:TonB-dependent receptor plug domain-containing protein n=1 Tax=Pedobacter alpinus TaxID=1590643 RepID=A0ABW5TVT0_9SPHI